MPASSELGEVFGFAMRRKQLSLRERILAGVAVTGGIGSIAVFALTTVPGPGSLSAAGPVAFFFIIPIQIWVWAVSGEVALNLIAVGVLQMMFVVGGAGAYWVSDKREES